MLKIVVIPLIILSHYFYRGITMNIKNFFKNTKDAIVAFYTSGTAASYVAIGATIVTGLAALTLGTVLLVTAVTSDSKDANKATINMDITETTTEEETTTSPTTEATSTKAETTTEETTTEEPSTTVAETVETTTPEPTTPPPTIAVEDLNIGNAKEEATAETEPPKKQEFYEEETESETEPPTTKKEPVTTKPTTNTTTEPTTEPPVSEYACVVKGIDVSKWNSLDKKPIDWVKVKNQVLNM